MGRITQNVTEFGGILERQVICEELCNAGGHPFDVFIMAPEDYPEYDKVHALLRRPRAKDLNFLITANRDMQFGTFVRKPDVDSAIPTQIVKPGFGGVPVELTHQKLQFTKLEDVLHAKLGCIFGSIEKLQHTGSFGGGVSRLELYEFYCNLVKGTVALDIKTVERVAALMLASISVNGVPIPFTRLESYVTTPLYSAALECIENFINKAPLPGKENIRLRKNLTKILCGPRYLLRGECDWRKKLPGLTGDVVGDINHIKSLPLSSKEQTHFLGNLLMECQPLSLIDLAFTFAKDNRTNSNQLFFNILSV